MKAALEILGYREVYHMISILAGNPRDVDIWKRAYDAIYGGKGTFGKSDWDSLLGHCMVRTSPAPSAMLDRRHLPSLGRGRPACHRLQL